MTVREYCNMLIIANGMDIKESVIQSAERYMSDNVLGLSMEDVVETYRLLGIGESDDYLLNISRTVYMLPNNSKLEAEYKNKCRELIHIRNRIEGNDVKNINAKNVMKKVIDLHSNMAKLLIKNIGNYDKDSKTLNILGGRFRNVRETSMSFMPGYRGLIFREGNYRVELEIDKDTRELGIIATKSI